MSQFKLLTESQNSVVGPAGVSCSTTSQMHTMSEFVSYIHVFLHPTLHLPSVLTYCSRRQSELSSPHCERDFETRTPTR